MTSAPILSCHGIEFPSVRFISHRVTSSESNGTLAQQSVVIVSRQISVDHHRIPIREVEDHGIITLHITETWQAAIRDFNPFQITRTHVGSGNRVVNEGQGQRGLGNLGSIAHFTHHQVISNEHAVFHGGGGNHEGLKNIAANQRSHHGCPQNGLAPVSINALLELRPISRPNELTRGAIGEPRHRQPWHKPHPPLLRRFSVPKGNARLHVQNGHHDQIGPWKQKRNQPAFWTLEHIEPSPIIQTRHNSMPSSQPHTLEQTRQRRHVNQRNK